MCVGEFAALREREGTEGIDCGVQGHRSMLGWGSDREFYRSWRKYEGTAKQGPINWMSFVAAMTNHCPTSLRHWLTPWRDEV
jgi:hypothetical protein